ncbi:MAG: tRNA (N6-threonylcarbamoyladenosine(37)-N6)-methyltransferase TrmO [Dehalococcoidales bacterium]|jgi:tRNA-Thr(GGU) m(6)t(6)A37 methyltransferase TsaA
MEDELPEITFKAIGTVRNEIKTREKRETADIVSEIVLDPALTESLDDLDGFSHIIVFFYFHQSRRPSPMKVHPRYRKLPGPVGVFASRSPDRPNPLGKTTVALLERRANVLKVKGLDAMDGTPVIDIKPYMPGLDAADDARMPAWMTNTEGAEMDGKASGEKTFTRMMHVGVVVRDMAKTIERLAELGIGPFTPRVFDPDARETYRGQPFIPSQRVAAQITQIGNIELELIQPIDGQSPHREFLDAKGEGIQHLGFIVEDLEKETARLKAQGAEILLAARFKGGGGVTYLDLEAAGLIVELVQPGHG